MNDLEETNPGRKTLTRVVLTSSTASAYELDFVILKLSQGSDIHSCKM